MQFDTFKTEAGLNRFIMTPSKWIEQTGAIAITSKAGRYGGGTYAHSDIAMVLLCCHVKNGSIGKTVGKTWCKRKETEIGVPGCCTFAVVNQGSVTYGYFERLLRRVRASSTTRSDNPLGG